MSLPSLAIAATASEPRTFELEAPLAEALRARGARVELVDWRATAGRDFDAILVRTTWDYTDHYEAFRAWYETERARVWNSFEAFDWNRDRRYLLGLAAAGIPIVPTLAFDPGSPAERAEIGVWLEGLEGREICLKPSVSAGSRRTYRLSPEISAIDERLREFAPGEGILLQPFVESVASSGEASLVFFAGPNGEPALSHATAKRPRAGDFRVQSEFGGEYRAFEPDPGLVELSRQALTEVPGRWVFARVDWLDWEESPQLGEIELIEPDLYYRHAPEAPGRLAEAFLARLASR